MIGIIDYNAGNLQSVCNTLEKANIKFLIAKTPDALKKVEKIIFPGVGHAKSCMNEIQKRGFDQFLKTTKKPVLGICVGMQMLFDFSEEGDTKCLGIIKGKVEKFDKNIVKIVPHMGWNNIVFDETENIFSKIPSEKDFYFVHSYFCHPEKKEEIIGTTEVEGFLFTSAVQKDNFLGVQFHPEKSNIQGINFLKNFCSN